MTKTPDCIGGSLPPGAAYCVVRPVGLTRRARKTFVTVLTTQTSRWRVRRNLPGESFDQSAPGTPQGFAAKLAAPFDGSAVSLSWSPPAERRWRGDDVVPRLPGRHTREHDKRRPRTIVVKDSGPGEHVFQVAAVNAIGQGATSSATIKLAPAVQAAKGRRLSEARPGGKLTAGAKWKATGRLRRVRAHQVQGRGLQGQRQEDRRPGRQGPPGSSTSSSSKQGRYFFKVKARNSDRWGPWSKPTDPGASAMGVSKASRPRRSSSIVASLLVGRDHGSRSDA